MLDGGIERQGLFLMKKKAVKKVMKKPAPKVKKPTVKKIGKK